MESTITSSTHRKVRATGGVAHQKKIPKEGWYFLRDYLVPASVPMPVYHSAVYNLSE